MIAEAMVQEQDWGHIEGAAVATDRAIAADAEMLSAQLQAMRDRLFQPEIPQDAAQVLQR